MHYVTGEGIMRVVHEAFVLRTREGRHHVTVLNGSDAILVVPVAEEDRWRAMDLMAHPAHREELRPYVSKYVEIPGAEAVPLSVWRKDDK